MSKPLNCSITDGFPTWKNDAILAFLRPFRNDFAVHRLSTVTFTKLDVPLRRMGRVLGTPKRQVQQMACIFSVKCGVRRVKYIKYCIGIQIGVDRHGTDNLTGESLVPMRAI